MTPELEAIRDDLDTRNVIAYVSEKRYAVNCVRTNHQQRVVLLTINGKVVAETVFNGPERVPAQNEVFRLRKLFNCERWE